MANKVADQLMILRGLLKQAGWQRVNGNTWRSGTYSLHTAYVHGEATLEVRHDKQAHDYLCKYTGAEPLTWASTEAPKIVKKLFTNQLDTELEQE